MSNNFPLVSVVIPTYNRTDYLKITLNSVIEQTYSNIEIIVVDDGTPSDENEILCNSFSGVKYFKIENTGGPCKPRNFGISKSKGTYIGFVDDDDVWLPNKIELQVKILEENSDFDLVHSCCKVIDEHGINTGRIVGKPGSPSVKHGEVFMRMIGNWTIMMPTPLIRMELVKKVGKFNPNMPQTAADVEYWSRCAFYTKFYYIDEPLVNYRIHANNMSADSKNYVSLPLHLYEVVVNMAKQKVIDKRQQKILKTNLIFMQAKMIKNNNLGVISNLFKFDPFWFLKIRVLKVILKNTIS